MKPSTKPRHPRSTAEERENWISDFLSSGLTQARFAQRHGLKLTTLQKWLYGRGSHLAPKRKSPVPAHGDRSHRNARTAAIIRKPRRTPNVTFRQIMLPALAPGRAGWAAEVTWPSGVTVRFDAGAEAAWMGAVLGAVGPAC